MSAATLFWWEEGYNKSASEAALAEQLKNKRTIQFDYYGDSFLDSILVTDQHHLHGGFLNNSLTFVSLNEPGKGRHQKNSSVSLYSIVDKKLTLNRTFQVGDNSGFFAISKDDTIMAIGILKADHITVFEIDSGDLLVELKGGQKKGFWGNLRFLENSEGNNNSLMELRVIEMDKGRAKVSLLRLWDLGFKPEDSDEDEVETKLWEKKKSGGIMHYTSAEMDSIICTVESATKLHPNGADADSASCLEWLDRQTGTIRRVIKPMKWCSKSIISKNLKYVAVAHFYHSVVYDALTGEELAIIKSPDTDEVYPVVPIGFVENDTILILRINYVRTLLVCNWRTCSDFPGSMLAIANVGGTISDDCVAISKDETKLICWPFGEVEMYDFIKIREAYHRKCCRALRKTCVQIKTLFDQQRATEKPNADKFGKMIHFVLGSKSGDDIFRHVMTFL